MGMVVDGGVRWAAGDLIAGLTNPAGDGQAATHDGAPVRVSLFASSIYVGIWESESPTFVKRAWHDAWAAGNEMNNHPSPPTASASRPTRSTASARPISSGTTPS